MTQWLGFIPTSCDICGDAIASEFYDGATQYGRWAFMCVNCWRIVGVGIGAGRGQRYIQHPGETVYRKTEG